MNKQPRGKTTENCKLTQKNEIIPILLHYFNAWRKKLPVTPPKLCGKRSKLAKCGAHKLWERLKIHEGTVMLFAKDPHVSFTNNKTERDLRMLKVKQKVSGSFRTSE